METDLGRRSVLTGGAAVAAAAAAVGASVINASPAAAAPLAPLYLAVGPIRLYDTRDGDGKIVRGDTYNLGGGFADPSELAYNFNVTITGTTGANGYLSVFPGDEGWPGNSSINWFAPGQTLANNALTNLSFTDGSINVFCGGSSSASSTHFILDLMAIIVIVDIAEFNPLTLTQSVKSAQGAASRKLRRL